MCGVKKKKKKNEKEMEEWCNDYGSKVFMKDNIIL